MPLISIIVPNYNHSKFLSQRIESILDQTFQDFEIILMDDFSTDNSREIIEKYSSHPKVTHTVYNAENSGNTFKQWEKGIELAQGKYVWLAESDDWCEPSFLQYMLEGFAQDEECVVSYCQSYFVLESNTITSVSTGKYLSEVVEGHQFLKDRLLLYNPIFNASMVLWKKEIFPMIPKEFKNYRLCGDWCFWMEVCTLGKVHVSGRVLNYFRSHENNVSTQAMKSGLNLLETLQVINYFYKREIITEKDYYKVFKIHFRNYYKVKDVLEQSIKNEIELLFKYPLTSRLMYFKILLGTQWKYKKF